MHKMHKLIQATKIMITIAEIKSMTKEQRKSYAQGLRPYIFLYLEYLGYNAGTKERPRNIACPVCGNGTNTPCAAVDPSCYFLKCFSCGEWIDVVGLSQKLHGGTFSEAIADVVDTVGGPLPDQVAAHEPNRQRPTDPERPPDVWTLSTDKFVKRCCAALWDYNNRHALYWLTHDRGLKPDTLKHFQIGFSAYSQTITIPTYVPFDGENVIMRVKQRYLYQREERSKYAQYPGSVASVPFNADALKHDPYVILVEGEIDAMTLWQTARDLIAPVTFGSVTSTPDPYVWRDWLKCPDVICVCGDNDAPGRTADAKTYKSIQRLKDIRRWNGEDRTDERHVFRASLPEGVKDWNEYYTSGGDVRGLIESMLSGKA